MNSKPICRAAILVVFVAVTISCARRSTSAFGLDAFKVCADNAIGTGSPCADPNTAAPTGVDVEQSIKALMGSLAVTGDPFALDAVSRSKITCIVNGLKANLPKNNVILNGTTYANLGPVTINHDVWYLKPTGVSLPEAEYFKVFSIIDSIPIEIDRNIFRIVFDAITSADEDRVATITSLKAYLDMQVAGGVITSYEYEPLSGEIYLHYRGDNGIAYLIRTFQYPRSLTEEITVPENVTAQLASYEREFAANNVLLINTLRTPSASKMQPRSELLRIFEILLNDTRTRKEKVSDVSKGLGLAISFPSLSDDSLKSLSRALSC